MTRRLRLALLAGTGLLALAGAGNALAAYAPKLVIGDDAKGITIDYSQAATDDPTAKLTFYIPIGYALGAATTGATIGTVAAGGTAADLGGAALPLTGTVVVRDAATGTYLSSGQPVPISAAAMQCTGTATHAAAWVAILSAAGQTLEVPLFLDPTTGAEALFAAAKLVICLPPPDLPAGTAGRATFGFKLTQAAFTVKGVIQRPAAPADTPYIWRLVATPYTPLKGTPNAAGTIETQSQVGYPRSLVFSKPKLQQRTAAGLYVYALSGTVGVPQGQQGTVALLKGPSATKLTAFARPPVSGSGFSAKLSVKQGAKAQTLYVQAKLTVPNTDLGAAGCVATFQALGVPCIGATAAGFTITSTAFKVTVPAKPKKK
jgi:hypothetical protein